MTEREVDRGCEAASTAGTPCTTVVGLSIFLSTVSIYRWAFAAFLRLVPDAKRRLRQMTAMRTFSTLSMAEQAQHTAGP